MIIALGSLYSQVFLERIEQAEIANSYHKTVAIHNLKLSLENRKNLETVALSNKLTSKDIKTMNAKIDILDRSTDTGKKRWARVLRVKDAITSTAHPILNCQEIDPNDALRIAGYIVDNSTKYGVPVPLILGVIKRETAFCQTAESAAGAYGIMQLMEETANGISAHLGAKLNRYDTADNVRMGVYYLSSMLSTFKNNEELAVKAYNSGPGHVKKVEVGELSKYHDETSAYWEAVKEFKLQYEGMGL